MAAFNDDDHYLHAFQCLRMAQALANGLKVCVRGQNQCKSILQHPMAVVRAWAYRIDKDV
jgi:hypothetical protein